MNLRECVCFDLFGEEDFFNAFHLDQYIVVTNASAISVHPTGMAIDLRRSDSSGCRQWLETVLLDLEGKGVIEATREQYPPHYHVAVFPNPYLQYVASGEALPEIQVAKSTRETASRPRIVRAVSRRRAGRRSRAHAVVAVSHHRASSRHRKAASRIVHAAHRRSTARHHAAVARAKSSGSRHARTQIARAR
jgi:hypothetical protein